MHCQANLPIHRWLLLWFRSGRSAKYEEDGESVLEVFLKAKVANNVNNFCAGFKLLTLYDFCTLCNAQPHSLNNNLNM